MVNGPSLFRHRVLKRVQLSARGRNSRWHHLQEILKRVSGMFGDFEIAVERIDLAGSALAEGKLVNAVGKVVGVVVDHQG